MLQITFNTPVLKVEHWAEIRAITSKTIKNSLSEKMRERYKKIISEVEPEDSFGMMAAKYGNSNDEIFTPSLYKINELPEDIRDFLWMCYLGSHEYYCKQKGLIK